MSMSCQVGVKKSIPGRENQMSRGLKEDRSLLAFKVVGWGGVRWEESVREMTPFQIVSY